MQIFRDTVKVKSSVKTVDLKAVKKDQTEIDVSVRISPFITGRTAFICGIHTGYHGTQTAGR
jgi:hypothetical protein